MQTLGKYPGFEEKVWKRHGGVVKQEERNWEKVLVIIKQKMGMQRREK